jgi:hypothetical protein
VLLKNQSCRCEQNTFAPALKERDAKAGLQVTHLLRNARLGDSKAISRPAETPRFRHGQEVTQVPDFKRIVHRDQILGGPIWKCN